MSEGHSHQDTTMRLKTAKDLLSKATVLEDRGILPCGIVVINRRDAIDGKNHLPVWGEALAPYAADGYTAETKPMLPGFLSIHKTGTTGAVKEVPDIDLYPCKIAYHEVLADCSTNPRLHLMEVTRPEGWLENFAKERANRGESYLQVPPSYRGQTLIVLEFFVAGNGWHEAPLTQCKVFTNSGIPVTFEVITPG